MAGGLLSFFGGTVNGEAPFELRGSLEARIRALETGQTGTPVGTIIAYYGASIPVGWLLCNGGSFSSTTYPQLYTLLGTTTLPDLRGKALVGYDAGQVEFNTLGGVGGAKTHTLTVAQMPTHDHGPPFGGDRVGDAAGFTPDVFNANVAAGATGFYYRGATPMLSLVPQGSSQPHNNLQPYAVVNYLIKAA